MTQISRGWVSALLVLVAVAVVFGNSLAGEFVWDDRNLIAENQAISSWKNLPRFFLHPFEYLTALGAEVNTYYRPIVLVSFLVDRTMWGENPFGYHLTNLILHAACSLFVLGLGRKFLGNQSGLFAALLFAVHPIHTESVAWISGRTDLLASVFSLAAVCLYLRTRSDEVASAARMIPVVLAFGLALLSKEVAFGLPFFFVLVEWLWRREGVALRLVPIVATLAIYVIFSQGIVGMNPLAFGEGFNDAPGLVLRVITSGKLLFLYAMKVMFPLLLNAEWEPDWIGSFSVDALLWPFLCALALWGLFSLRRKNPLLVALGGWFILFLGPVLNVVPIKEIGAERFLYLPSVAFAGLLGLWLSWVKEPGKRIIVLAGLIVLLFGVRTVERNLDWSNDLRLFAVTAQDAKGQPRAKFNLAREHHRQGLELLNRGKAEGDPTLEARGRERIEKALRGYREVSAEGFGNLSVVLGLGQAFLALDEIQEAVRTYQDGIDKFPDSVEVSYGLCELFFKLGDDDKARELAEAIVEKFPEFAEARRVLGILAYRRGDLLGAEKELTQAAVALPSQSDIFQVLGVIYSRQRRPAEAVLSYQQALEIDPVDLTSMGNLAKLFAYMPLGSPFHRPSAALELAKRASRYDPRVEFFETIAQAYAGLGDFEKALETVEEILASNPPNPQPYLEMKARITDWRDRAAAGGE